MRVTKILDLRKFNPEVVDNFIIDNILRRMHWVFVENEERTELTVNLNVADEEIFDFLFAEFM